jgi:hypothetical protein
LASSCGTPSSPFQSFSPPGPPVSYGVVKAAVLPCGDPSKVILQPPIFKGSLCPHTEEQREAMRLEGSSH